MGAVWSESCPVDRRQSPQPIAGATPEREQLAITAELTMRFRALRTKFRWGHERRFYTGGAMLALLLVPLAWCAGCDDTTSQEFRAAALDSIHQGFNSIAEGILNGIFAVAQPAASSGTSGDTTGDGSTTGDTTTTGGTPTTGV